ncbi:transposase domain-containing protein [uncultured Vibrio sp.]|uniref:transposase domain-containing protein n=1 Tax=uncultured Vibrio sp. TaxID=114054 RepID=UPI0026234387|nr:transposase domain-containing protein [uncultured Vibrio sp.]
MSEFSLELQATAELQISESIDSFRKNIPVEWISEAVQQTGRAAVRKRRFPAEQAVWLVLGAYFGDCDRSFPPRVSIVVV